MKKFISVSVSLGLLLSALSLMFVVSCGKADSADNDIYTETVADYTLEGEDKELFYFKINFIAEEGEGVDGGEFGGKPFKNRPIEAHTVEYVNEVKQSKGYKPGIKPLKHQKRRIKYEKKYPYMFKFLEDSKYQDEQGNIVELK